MMKTNLPPFPVLLQISLATTDKMKNDQIKLADTSYTPWTNIFINDAQVNTEWTLASLAPYNLSANTFLINHE